MGQDHSLEERQPVSTEELTTILTNKFAQKSFTQLEIYCFQHLFTSLADSSSGLQHFSESTLTRFLELPDVLFGAGSVIYQMATWLGAFPFPSQAPAILTKDAMLRVITLAAGRYGTVLPGLDGEKGRRRWWAELYRSLAVYDRGIGGVGKKSAEGSGADDDKEKSASDYRGFAVDAPGEDAALFGVGDDDDEDDGLVLAALDSMSALEAFRQGEKADVQHSFIPADNLLKLLELLVLIAPLGPQNSLAAHAAAQLAAVDDDDDERQEKLEELRRTARSMLVSFGDSSGGPGIGHKAFMKVVESSLPALFDGLGPLFEHFLFAKDFDLAKRRMSSSAGVFSPPPTSPTSPTTGSTFSARLRSKSSPHPALKSTNPPPLLLPRDAPDLLTMPLLSQLSFFLPPPKPFGSLVPLFDGSTHGFSMGAFEKHVFNWQAPSILLVRGSLLPPRPSNSRERAFIDTLPLKTLPNSRSRLSTQKPSQPAPRAITSPSSPIPPTFQHASLHPEDAHDTQATADENNDDEDTSPDPATNSVIYGAYIPTPWKTTPKHPFSTSATLLFSLRPHHAVHKASTAKSATDFAYFNKPGISRPAGLGFGSPVASGGAGGASSGRSARLALGPVSLHLDDGLEYGVFTHLAEGGGSFLPNPLPLAPPSPLPPHTHSSSSSSSPAVGGPPSPDYRDVFLVEDVVVLGVGGEEEMEQQRKRWRWEEREAELRRGVNVKGTGDVEADRELLRMAGLLGAERSGGSMG